mmetsp:Transcript_33828/g.52169  ORF Transcript_33828/g.52169 Transcript_33828/m.52169 type:complete len:119 (-) Transcript_33828:28-384(-)
MVVHVLKRHKNLLGWFAIFKLMTLVQMFLVEWFLSDNNFLEFYFSHLFEVSFWSFIDFVFGALMSTIFLVIEFVLHFMVNSYVLRIERSHAYQQLLDTSRQTTKKDEEAPNYTLNSSI